MAANRQFVFTSDGTIAGGGPAIDITIGAQTITVDPGGWVQGP